MRQLPKRPELPARTKARLEQATIGIAGATDKKAEARKRYENARGAAWFRPVVDRLRQLSGPGERCMFCSGSESSEVEHYRPKSVFPELAMTWENFLWSCGVCNLAKGNRFPPDTETGERLINPIDENVWDFFSLDEFGNLLPKWRLDLDDLDPRAVSTRNVLKLDRQLLQESRYQRRRELVQGVGDSLAQFDRGELTMADLVERRKAWLEAPFQPDVADYYLNGPGGDQEPFARFLREIRGT